MKITIPQKVNYIIRTLHQNGYEAYIVGGCVRDAILGREPADWDITTSAKPLQVKSMFSRTIDTGIKHGTVTVLMDQDPFEVTTYRIDGDYEDHRRPESVTFTTSLEEDLKRRDFTMNAMAYNDDEGLIDPFDGMGDMEKQMIRAVGDPVERFDEDALRMLRAIRFAAQLDFAIEKKTRDAIGKKYELLEDVSAERIQMELSKMMTSKAPQMLGLACKLGLTSIFLPEFDAMMETPQNNPHHKYNVGEHTLKALQSSEPDLVLRLAILLHDVGKPEVRTTDEQGVDHFYKHDVLGAAMAEVILRRLKYDNKTIKEVKHLIGWHDLRWDEEASIGIARVRRMISKVGVDSFVRLVALQRADVLAQSSFKQEHKLQSLDKVEEIYKEVKKNKDCLTIKDLDIDGVMLMRMAGIPTGKPMGKVLDTLLNMVIEEPALNKRPVLLELAKKIHEAMLYM